MNRLERQMVELLLDARQRAGVVALKAEFEAEGTRPDELHRLNDVARAVGLPLALKIGGCEAVTDLYHARLLGVRYVVAPMVESPYAATKFVDAKNRVYAPDERQDTSFLFNVETVLGYRHREEIVQAVSGPDGADGIVFGRVDFVGSMGWSRDRINLPDVTRHVLDIAALCKQSGLELVVGGGVSIDALAVLQSIAEVRLDRFETRKVIFDAGIALGSAGLEKGLLDAVEFEVLWLRNKRDYYGGIASEEAARVAMLEARWAELRARM